MRRAGAKDADGYSALCLSGGGIRSAAFALGVIEGLARRNVLEAFDYLSTVSGGGFAGGWLSAWLFHAAASGDRDKVFRQLSGSDLEEGRTEASPVSHMRAYSRYMSPQLGALSADSWTLVATMLRNVFLNWMVLLPLTAAGLLAPRVYLELVQAFDRPLMSGVAPAISILEPLTLLDAARMSPAATALLIVSVILQFGGVAYMVTDLPSYGNRRRPQSDFLRVLPDTTHPRNRRPDVVLAAQCRAAAARVHRRRIGGRRRRHVDGLRTQCCTSEVSAAHVGGRRHDGPDCRHGAMVADQRTVR